MTIITYIFCFSRGSQRIPQKILLIFVKIRERFLLFPKSKLRRRPKPSALRRFTFTLRLFPSSLEQVVMIVCPACDRVRKTFDFMIAKPCFCIRRHEQQLRENAGPDRTFFHQSVPAK